MFFQLCIVGAYTPILSVYLKDHLGFTGIQIGVILSMSAIPSILAPFISAWIVDRIITSRRFLALCQTAAAITIYIMSIEKSYNSILITYLIYMMFLVPTFALVNALVFHNEDEKGSFGFIRLWGTIGWVAAGWTVSIIWKFTDSSVNMPYALQLSAFFSLIVVILTLKLPKRELDKNKTLAIIPVEAFKVVVKPEVLLLLFVVFISACADKFYFYGTPLFLQDIGIKKDNILPVLSLGQAPEVIMLFTLASLIKRLGFKSIFTIALSMQVLRFLIFWFNGPIAITLIGVSLNGFIYALFYATSTIYLDTFTDTNSRGGSHQLFSLITVGAAGFTGNLLAGWAAGTFTILENINFRIFWIIPIAISITAFLTIKIFMKRVINK